jgi:hypothetical protein
MKVYKSFAFILVFLQLTFELAGQPPVILNQPTTVKACDGDTITLTVVTDSVYDYQWFTASKNGTSLFDLTELPGENSNRLTFYAIGRAHYIIEKFYVLRVINEPDTLWSQEIAVSIHYVFEPFSNRYLPFNNTQPPFNDTIRVNSRSKSIYLYGGIITYEKAIFSTGKFA